jgi:hypothetical protein
MRTRAELAFELGLATATIRLTSRGFLPAFMLQCHPWSSPSVVLSRPKANHVIANSSVFTLSIIHSSDKGFLDSFRADLAAASKQVVILSPFLSGNRASHYYPVFEALVVRNVAVAVYARPRKEQPEGLRDHYSEVEHRLRVLGAQFSARPGMHEKVAVIDGRILWHGSLNILSHNDTRESMLRFDSSELVGEILTDLGLGSYSHIQPGTPLEPSPARETSEVSPQPRCPACGGHMLFFTDASMWLCSLSPSCAGALPVSEVSQALTPGDMDKPRQRLGILCPICSSEMMIIEGISRRIECVKLDCHFAFDRRLSSGIIRVLKRNAVL